MILKDATKEKIFSAIGQLGHSSNLNAFLAYYGGEDDLTGWIENKQAQAAGSTRGRQETIIAIIVLKHHHGKLESIRALLQQDKGSFYLGA